MTEYLMEDGTLSQKEHSLQEQNVVAKSVYMEESETWAFFIKAAKGMLYNPHSPRHTSNPRRLELHWKWRKVKQETMEFYVKFIQTKNPLHYKHAERSKSMGA